MMTEYLALNVLCAIPRKAVCVCVYVCVFMWCVCECVSE